MQKPRQTLVARVALMLRPPGAFADVRAVAAGGCRSNQGRWRRGVVEHAPRPRAAESRRCGAAEAILSCGLRASARMACCRRHVACQPALWGAGGARVQRCSRVRYPPKESPAPAAKASVGSKTLASSAVCGAPGRSSTSAAQPQPQGPSRAYRASRIAYRAIRPSVRVPGSLQTICTP